MYEDPIRNPSMLAFNVCRAAVQPVRLSETSPQTVWTVQPGGSDGPLCDKSDCRDMSIRPLGDMSDCRDMSDGPLCDMSDCRDMSDGSLCHMSDCASRVSIHLEGAPGSPVTLHWWLHGHLAGHWLHSEHQLFGHKSEYFKYLAAFLSLNLSQSWSKTKLSIPQTI